MPSGLFELAAIVVLAATLGVVARIFKQPIILAYLVTGVIVGYFGIFMGHGRESFDIFASLGVMFLLFLVGLEVNYASLRLVGSTALFLGIGQVVVSTALGFGVGRLLGFTALPALYLGLALSFSSTIIVVKFLSEKKDLGSLYGKLSIGLLLVQDVVAILILVLLSGVITGDGLNWIAVVMALLKSVLLFGFMLWLGRSILPFVFDRVARIPELLFLISLAWVFLVAALVSKIGFSVEIAGLLAGLALANSSEHFQIASRIRSLRDFFILIFFVILGSSLVGTNFSGLWLPLIVTTLFVLIINPIVVMAIMGILGYKRRTSFFTGISITQVSEFSLILLAVGVQVQHISESLLALATATAITTIIGSSYLSSHADQLFRRLRHHLRWFERKSPRKEGNPEEAFEKPFVLIGANRVGESIARHLPEDELLVIEFDPEVVQKLKTRGIDHIFGDVNDVEVLERANLEASRLVISTSPDVQDNLNLLEYVNLLAKRPKVIVRAETESDADTLYEAGADYVLLPHFTSGQYLGKTLAVDPEMKVLEGLRMSDMEMLGKIG